MTYKKTSPLLFDELEMKLVLVVELKSMGYTLAFYKNDVNLFSVVGINHLSCIAIFHQVNRLLVTSLELHIFNVTIWLQQVGASLALW